MKIILRLVLFYFVGFMNVPVCAYDHAESEAMTAFAQDPISLQAIKHHNKPRRILFKNNLKREIERFSAFDPSMHWVDPVCIINGKVLNAADVREVDVENNYCRITIQLRPGFTQFVESLGRTFWSNLVRCFERYLLQSRSLTFICDLTDCHTVDTATLFFQAYSETEMGNYNVGLKFPFGLEITLPSPIKYCD